MASTKARLLKHDFPIHGKQKNVHVSFPVGIQVANGLDLKSLAIWASKVEISPAIYRAEKPENPKSLKKVSREEFGPPDPGPQKSPKKVRKVKKIVDFQTFS